MSTSTLYFVVVRAKNLVRVINASFEVPPKIGDGIKRDRLTEEENWTVVKVFDFDQQRKLEALWLLMGGMDNLSWIMDINL